MNSKELERKKRQAAKQWKLDNKEHIAEYNKVYQAANYDKMCAKSKRWRDNNKEQMKRNNASWNKRHPQERRDFVKKWQTKNPRYRPDYLLRYNYNMTLDEHERIAAEQGNVCIVCKKPQKQTGRVKRLHVDHDHKCCAGSKSCGKCIRGLTCTRCNLVLGEVKDNIELLKAMVKYLRSKKRVKINPLVAIQKKKPGQKRKEI